LRGLSRARDLHLPEAVAAKFLTPTGVEPATHDVAHVEGVKSGQALFPGEPLVERVQDRVRPLFLR